MIKRKLKFINCITSDNHNIALLNLYKQTYFLQFIKFI